MGDMVVLSDEFRELLRKQFDPLCGVYDFDLDGVGVVETMHLYDYAAHVRFPDSKMKLCYTRDLVACSGLDVMLRMIE